MTTGRVRERQHRDLELPSEMLGRFLRIWMSVHALVQEARYARPLERSCTWALRPRWPRCSVAVTASSTTCRASRAIDRRSMASPDADTQRVTVGARSYVPLRGIPSSAARKPRARRADSTVARCLPAAFAIWVTFPSKRR